jgi:hypothetical protein
VAAALDLRCQVSFELAAEELDRLAVDRAEVRAVGDVVDHFLSVALDDAEVIKLPAHPLGVIPLRQ